MGFHQWLQLMLQKSSLDGEWLFFFSWFSKKSYSLLKVHYIPQNPYNMLGDALNQNFTKMFPPKEVSMFPSFSEIKQISLGWDHTSILCRNNTVLCVGSNDYGKCGQDSLSSVFVTPVVLDWQSNFCPNGSTCTVEFVTTTKYATYLGIDIQDPATATKNSYEISPICFGKSHLDISRCSSNGGCLADDFCSCYTVWNYFSRFLLTKNSKIRWSINKIRDSMVRSANIRINALERIIHLPSLFALEMECASRTIFVCANLDSVVKTAQKSDFSIKMQNHIFLFLRRAIAQKFDQIPIISWKMTGKSLHYPFLTLQGMICQKKIFKWETTWE